MSDLPDKNDQIYWNRVKQWAIDHHSDGCTFAFEAYKECCFEHDIHASGKTLDGDDISWNEAADRLRICIQQRSIFGRFSPMSQWRWGVLRLWGIITRKT